MTTHDEGPPPGGPSSLPAAALRYLPRTVPLLPRDKRPALSDWPDWEATREAVEQWWTEHPDSNVGIRLGGGLVALDVDPRAGGDDVLADLEHERGIEFPATVTVLSGGADGGRHLYFAAPAELETFTVGAGVQVRALAGTGRPMQCVAPPSIHPDTGREYRFAEGRDFGEVKIARLPEWVAARRFPYWEPGGAQPIAPTPPEEWVAMLRAIPDGQRNETLTRLTGHLLRRDIDVDVAAELVHAVNAARCLPALEAREVDRIVDSIARAELRRRQGGA
jgi:hypothetical protein